MEKNIDGKRFILLIEEDKGKFVMELRNYTNSDDNKLNNLLQEFVDNISNLDFYNVKFSLI